MSLGVLFACSQTPLRLKGYLEVSSKSKEREADGLSETIHRQTASVTEDMIFSSEVALYWRIKSPVRGTNCAYAAS